MISGQSLIIHYHAGGTLLCSFKEDMGDVYIVQRMTEHPTIKNIYTCHELLHVKKSSVKEIVELT